MSAGMVAFEGANGAEIVKTWQQCPDNIRGSMVILVPGQPEPSAQQEPSEPVAPLCRCGHSRKMHDERAKCGSGWCSCVHYRPESAPSLLQTEVTE